MTEEQIQKYEKWLDDNSNYDVILSAEILSDLTTLQQQNKQLIEAMDRASDLLSHNHNAYHYLQDALQQIPDERRRAHE